MKKFIKVSQNEIEEIAKEYKVEASIIQSVIRVLEDYVDVYYESFKVFTSLPKPKYSEPIWLGTPEELAKLSMLYHEQQKEIESADLTIFHKVIFKHNKVKAQDLELTEFLANDIIWIYIQKLQSGNLIMDQDKAKEILNRPKKYGKQQTEYTFKRNEMVRAAASILRKGKISNYTQVLVNIFDRIGYKGLTANSVTTIVSRSS